MIWRKKVFLDYASATPVLPEVLRAVKKSRKHFHNPNAIYEEGRLVAREIDAHRTRLARFLGVTKDGINFTSGGTESVQLAILGIFEKARESIKAPHLIISATEHASAMRAADEVRRRGGKVSIVPVDEEGLVSPEEVIKLIKPSTFLISIILASNEIGTVQNIAKIGRFLRQRRNTRNIPYPYLHTDASQAPSYLDVNLEKLSADMVSLDSGKIYGPKGVGILAEKKNVKILHSSSGTESLELIAGFATAFGIVTRDREAESRRLGELKEYFIEELKKHLPEVTVNGSREHSLPNIISVSILGVSGEVVVLALEKRGVLASVGSACSYNEDVSGSDVIRAIGKGEFAESTIRFSMGRFTTRKEVDYALEMLYNLVNYDATIRTLHYQGQGSHPEGPRTRHRAGSESR